MQLLVELANRDFVKGLAVERADRRVDIGQRIGERVYVFL